MRHPQGCYACSRQASADACREAAWGPSEQLNDDNPVPALSRHSFSPASGQLSASLRWKVLQSCACPQQAQLFCNISASYLLASCQPLLKSAATVLESANEVLGWCENASRPGREIAVSERGSESRGFRPWVGMRIALAMSHVVFFAARPPASAHSGPRWD